MYGKEYRKPAQDIYQVSPGCLASRMFDGCHAVVGPVPVFKPCAPQIRILFVNDQLEILDGAREEDRGDHTGHACPNHNDFDRPEDVDRFCADIVPIYFVPHVHPAHTFLQAKHFGGNSTEVGCFRTPRGGLLCRQGRTAYVNVRVALQ